MSEHQSAYDASQGSPNLEVLQYLQDNMTATDIAALKRFATVSISPSGGNQTFTIPVGAKIIDAKVICTGANSGGTVQIKTGGASAISDAMICAVDKVVVRAGAIDNAYNVVGSTGVIAVPGQVDDTGDVYITYTK